MIIFGRHIFPAREVAWHGEADHACTESGTTKQTQPRVSITLESGNLLVLIVAT